MKSMNQRSSDYMSTAKVVAAAMTKTVAQFVDDIDESDVRPGAV
jgi:hypothetical protein